MACVRGGRCFAGAADVASAAVVDGAGADSAEETAATKPRTVGVAATIEHPAWAADPRGAAADPDATATLRWFYCSVR